MVGEIAGLAGSLLGGLSWAIIREGLRSSAAAIMDNIIRLLMALILDKMRQLFKFQAIDWMVFSSRNLSRLSSCVGACH